MRMFILLILALLGAWFFWAGPGASKREPEPPMPVEETFIGDQVRVLNKAQDTERQYLESVDAHKQRLEEQLEDGGG